MFVCIVCSESLRISCFVFVFHGGCRAADAYSNAKLAAGISNRLLNDVIPRKMQIALDKSLGVPVERCK